MTLPCTASEPQAFMPPSVFPGSYVVPLACHVFWSLAYVLIIRRGFKERTCGMPLAALCANVAWEILFSLYPAPCKLNHYGNAILIAFDVLILLDLLMPEMDGFEFLEELRRRPGCERVPVIVITAKTLTDDKRHRLNGEVARVLEKRGRSKERLLAEVLAHLASPGKGIQA